jgi:hypothetical protein
MRLKTLFTCFLLIALLQLSAQTQPAQAATGYGGLAAPYGSVVKFNCDDGVKGFMLYIPATPHAASLPLIVFDHGFGEWNPLRYARWIDHLVKRGNIVVFPRYQQNEYTTASTSFTGNAVAAILRALDTIQSHPAWTQADLTKVMYMGHSYGGLISANLATNCVSYGIPKPKALFMACPGYGSYPGGQLGSYNAMDSSIHVLDIFEHDDTVVDSTFALQVFNQTTAVPYAHKNLVIHFADATGTPAVTSTHGESSCIDSSYSNGDNGVVMTQASYAYTNVTDFYCYWKLCDALEDCAFNGTGCGTAFGDTYPQKYMGLWSNGTPVRPLQVRPAAVITGLAAMDKTEALKVYPNPTDGPIAFDLQGWAEEMSSVLEVYSAEGRKMYSTVLHTNKPLQLDMTEQPAGLYFYRLLDKNANRLACGKLLKH